MAYLLASYNDNYGTTFSNSAYLRITDVQVKRHEQDAVVLYEVYASSNIAESGNYSPIYKDGHVFFSDTSTGNLYSDCFATGSEASSANVTANTVQDILQCQAYIGLKSHPSTANLVANATII
jgi:hypothetical protein